MKGTPQGTEPAVRLEGLARRFGLRWVLRGADLEVGRGEIVGLTGRNGSGKTTLLRIVATALRPTRGTGRIFGLELVREAAEIRELVGILGHEAGLYDDLTAAENLAFAERMRGRRPEPAALDRVLERVSLEAERDERVHGFSAGMRRRLALARLLLDPPSLLLLDEPYASFDADGIERVNDFAAEVAAGGGAALIATHDLVRGQRVIQRTIGIEDGRTSDRAVEVAREGDT